jgi:hypothetical protein
MKQKILLLTILCICIYSSRISAQFMHGVGVTFSGITGNVTTPSSSSGIGLTQSTITYFPRYNFVEKENSSISIGAPVGVGIGLVRNTYGGDVGFSFSYDLPVVLDYNIGARSTADNANRWGGYFGLGFGYFKVNISGSVYSNFDGATYGPLARGGVRFPASRNDDASTISLGVFFKTGLEKDKLTSFGFNMIYEL